MAVHERHAAQQCWYTFAAKRTSESKVILCSHEDAFAEVKIRKEPQDYLEYYDIAPDERESVLADLARMNITAYTLFRSIDSLIETIAPQVLDQSPLAASTTSAAPS